MSNKEYENTGVSSVFFLPKILEKWKWKSEWGGEIYMCHSNSRGIMILFKNNLDFTAHSMILMVNGFD